MFQNLTVRWALILILIGFAVVRLTPTFNYYMLSEDERIQLEKNEPEQFEYLKTHAINLGLDLQGGMHVILEADMVTMTKNISDKQVDNLLELISDAEQISTENQEDFFDVMEEIADERNFRLIRHYHKLGSSSDNASVMAEIRSRGQQAINSALEIIRNRVDQFGVSEPVIQKSGKNRIIVELAGVKDPDRARNLIQSTALLEFNLVRNPEDLSNAVKRIDEFLLAGMDEEIPDTSSKTTKDEEIIQEETDSIDVFSQTDDIFKTEEEELEIADLSTPSEILKTNPFSGYLQSTPIGIAIIESEFYKVREILERDDVNKQIPRESKFLWSAKPIEFPISEGTTVALRTLYYVKSEAWLTGGVVENAQTTFGAPGTDVSGQPVVNLTMNSDGAKIWSQRTGANVGRSVAIVLDNKVFMSPVIQGRIPGGRTLISGLEDVEEGKDIANVLRAGALPAPVNIIEERTVGPSLGKDSIASGLKALLLGFGLVILFMILYYNGCGLLTDTAVLMNVLLILGFLVALGATLTLPGIAGLILTIGMAVDANVIIFERIREELDTGTTVKSAIDSGYKRALVTILDANITTLIAAFVLWGIGSGPIKGFAIILSIGILCSMFTAIFVTRTILMFFSRNKPITTLSI